jgi:hypothetical protein
MMLIGHLLGLCLHSQLNSELPTSMTGTVSGRQAEPRKVERPDAHCRRRSASESADAGFSRSKFKPRLKCDHAWRAIAAQPDAQ